MAHIAVADIALMVGFGEVTSFYRAFRAAFGVPPGEFRAAGLRERQN